MSWFSWSIGHSLAPLNQPNLPLLITSETSETEITTTEIIKRRDVGPYGIRSEYCIRKIICPLGVPETPKGEIHILLVMTFFLDIISKYAFLTSAISPSSPETHTPQRKGLRSSALRPKKPEPAKQTGPVVIETWVAEEELDLWEIRAFSERWDMTGSQRLKRNTIYCLQRYLSKLLAGLKIL